MKNNNENNRYLSYRSFALSIILASSICYNIDAYVPNVNTFYRAKFHRESTHLFSAETSEASNAQNLPDYGSTPIEIDQIELPSISKKWLRKDLFGQTLVTETLENLETDEDFQQTSKRLTDIGAAAMTKEERTQRRRALEDLGVPDFLTLVEEKKREHDKESSSLSSGSDTKAMMRKSPSLLQINIGLYCNQACGHCHVESSPLRKEEKMTSETVARILTLLKNTPSIKTLDITGGAPELNENFRMLVSMARELRPKISDLEIIDRCNLTVLQEPGQDDLVEFLAENKVRVVASLPCYSAGNVDKQRGNGVFDRSISALLAFNQIGYGMEGNEHLKMDLVYNPLGAFLPPEQKSLEAKYKVSIAALLRDYSHVTAMFLHFHCIETKLNYPTYPTLTNHMKGGTSGKLWYSF